MNRTTPQDPLTVLYDGACPLCRREMAHLQGLAQRHADSALCFVDIRQAHGCAAAERDLLLARLHVERADGTRMSGAAAFVAMWGRLPGWRWLARLARLPGLLRLMEWAYRAFLHLRPALQALARRLERPGATTSAAASAAPPPTSPPGPRP